MHRRIKGEPVTDVDTSGVIAQAGNPGEVEPAAPGLKIFINYRHEDMPFAALMLYQELESRFGADNIFFDGGSLRPGMDWLEEIKLHLIGMAGAFIAVVGPSWTHTMTAHQQLGDSDYVVQEMELGLRNGWTFIPLLLNDAALPPLISLPPSIRAFPARQAAHLHTISWKNDLEDLTTRLDEISARPPATAAGIATPAAPPSEPPDDTASAGARDPEILSVDDEHYQTLIDEADNLVIFLGARANVDDRERPLPSGPTMPPDDTGLAEFLAAKARMTSGERELAEVAQYARMCRGESRVFDWVKEALRIDPEPGPVHTYLARLPRRLEELGIEKRYQMIVTPKLDVALEKALRAAEVPFDVAVYMGPKTEHAGRFVHIPWDEATPRVIQAPNDYHDFPINATSGQLWRTVVVRINGTISDATAGYPWENNFVITEDHYIDFVGGRAPEEVVPTQILAKLRHASCLFLGYAIADWRLRVFLHWIWPGESNDDAMRWAVEPSPSRLERRTWSRSGIDLYQSGLNDYAQGLDRFLVKNRGHLR